MGGVPCIRGMRVTVGMIAGMMRAGKSDEELLALYPYLESEDLDAVREYESSSEFTCPSCGSHYFGRDTANSGKSAKELILRTVKCHGGGSVDLLKTVRCHGGWSMDDPQKPACKWRGEWPPVEVDLSAERKQ